MATAAEKQRLLTEGLKSGWLQKQGHVFPTWNRRWMVLHPGRVVYFDGPNVANVLKGECKLAGARVALRPDGVHFAVSGTPDAKDFLFCAESNQDALSWCWALIDTGVVNVNVPPIPGRQPLPAAVVPPAAVAAAAGPSVALAPPSQPIQPVAPAATSSAQPAGLYIAAAPAPQYEVSHAQPVLQQQQQQQQPFQPQQHQQQVMHVYQPQGLPGQVQPIQGYQPQGYQPQMYPPQGYPQQPQQTPEQLAAEREEERRRVERKVDVAMARIQRNAFGMIGFR